VYTFNGERIAMLDIGSAYAGFSVDDIPAARDFYRSIGMEVTEIQEGLDLAFPGGGHAFVYPKPDHEPASYTTLYLEVSDIDAAVEQLAGLGIELERYEGMPQDEKGIMRGRDVDRGPNIGWFLDPARNVVAVVEN
jgi:catechol 2,3-dioxygenase-like lactoylglutathione lyase family enzyme